MNFKTTFKDINAEFDGNYLMVANKSILRHWRVCDEGMATVRLRNNITGDIFVDEPNNTTPDWQLFSLIAEVPSSALVKTEYMPVESNHVHNEHL